MRDLYKCQNCGHVFDREDAKVSRECVGEFWGAPAYIDFIYCPECDSDGLEEYDGTGDNEENDQID